MFSCFNNTTSLNENFQHTLEQNFWSTNNKQTDTMMADEVNINCTDQNNNNNSLFETQNQLIGDEFIYYFLIFSKFCLKNKKFEFHKKFECIFCFFL